MLSKFTVSNFKGFNDTFVFDLEENNRYAFNSTSLRDGIVLNSLIYGPNGVGKSNLGLALFDITHHLTDFQRNENLYINYLNADNSNFLAAFSYKFKFGEDTVLYTYKKAQNRALVSENLQINGKIVAEIDRRESSKARIALEGTETLNPNVVNEQLSLLKYIQYNSILKKNKENDIFKKFYLFVEGMIFFRSLDKNIYIGYSSGNSEIQSNIIDDGNVEEFQYFLNEAGIRCKLSYSIESGKKVIFFDFENERIPFFEIASTGTISLTLYYFWLTRLNTNPKTSLVFIDEFDAFYHHKLSTLIVEKLKKTNFQFILTTHNTSNISNEILRPDCYFLMYKNRINSLAGSTTKELREAHNIEKMYKAGAFNG